MTCTPTDGPVYLAKFTLWERKQMYAKMCNQKKQYFSEKSAKAALGNLIDTGCATLGCLSVYMCPFCGWWHIGHIPHELLPLSGDQRTLQVIENGA